MLKIKTHCVLLLLFHVIQIPLKLYNDYKPQIFFSEAEIEYKIHSMWSVIYAHKVEDFSTTFQLQIVYSNHNSFVSRLRRDTKKFFVKIYIRGGFFEDGLSTLSTVLLILTEKSAFRKFCADSHTHTNVHSRVTPLGVLQPWTASPLIRSAESLLAAVGLISWSYYTTSSRWPWLSTILNIFPHTEAKKWPQAEGDHSHNQLKDLQSFNESL